MPYVQRDENKKIVGCFVNAQKGYAEEFLPDNDPDVTAFFAVIDAPEPMNCSPLQARLALYNAGLLDQVNKYISGLDIPTQMAWEYADTIYQSNDVVIGAAQALGLTQDQVTQLFEEAKKL